MNKAIRSALVVASAVALLALGVGLTGCAKSGPDPAKLEGKWRLESFGPADDFAPDPTVTTEMKLEGGQASGKGGVNQFSGPYEAKDDGSLTFGAIVSTKMAGPEPAMTQENKFFEALGKTKRFDFNGEKLVLGSSNNDTLAVLVPK